jgi:hypothetical protein
MKTIFFLFCFLLCSTFSSFAQDTIWMKNGSIVPAVVQEISPEEVRYKRFGLEDGPLYIERKSAIVAIRYRNGLKEIFGKPVVPQQDDYVAVPAKPVKPVSTDIIMVGPNMVYKEKRISESDMHTMMLVTGDQKLRTMVYRAQESKGLQVVGFTAIPLGVASMLLFAQTQAVYRMSSDEETRTTVLAGVCLAGAIACPIFSGIQKRRRTLANQAAIRLYNEKY